MQVLEENIKKSFYCGRKLLKILEVPGGGAAIQRRDKNDQNPKSRPWRSTVKQFQCKNLKIERPLN